MTINEAIDALRTARETISATETFAGSMARILAGRLRAYRIGTEQLRALKRELRDFDMTTGEWKS